MPNNLRTNIEMGVQIVIAAAILVAASALVKRTVFPRPGNPPSLPRINVGERLDVPNVNWQRNKKSLVFFLKKDCPYCTSSAPFYRQLIDDASKRNVKSVAVLPNSPDEIQKYLRYLELTIDNVQSDPTTAYKISGTPTVLFVDEGGVVRGVWFGARPGQEKEMRDQLVQLFDAKTNN